MDNVKQHIAVTDQDLELNGEGGGVECLLALSPLLPSTLFFFTHLPLQRSIDGHIDAVICSLYSVKYYSIYYEHLHLKHFS